MKKKNCEGKKVSGAVLRVFLALVIPIIFSPGCKKNNEGPQPEITSIQCSANPPSVAYGGSTTITWKVLGPQGKLFAAIYKGDTISKKTSDKYAFSSLKEAADVFFVCVFEDKQPVTSSLHIPVGSAPLAPVIILTYDTATVSSGGTKTVSWNIQNPVDSARLNGTPIASVGSKIFTNLQKDTVLSFIAYGWGGTDQKTITIKVVPKPKNVEDALVVFPYRITDLVIDTAGNGNYVPGVIQDCERDDSLKFLVNDWFEQYQGRILCYPGSPQLFGNGPYYVEGDTLFMSTPPTPGFIKYWDAHALILEYKVPCSGCSQPYNYCRATYTNIWPIKKK